MKKIKNNYVKIPILVFALLISCNSYGYAVTNKKINSGIELNNIKNADFNLKDSYNSKWQPTVNDTILRDINLTSGIIYNLDIAKVNKDLQHKHNQNTAPTKVKISRNTTSSNQLFSVSFKNKSVKVSKTDNKNETFLTHTVKKFNQLLSNNKTTEAEYLIDTKISNNESNAWNLTEYANLYEKINKQDKALKTYEKAVSLSESRIEILYSYALCLYKNNDLEKAKTSLEKIIALNPNFMLAYFNLGNIYYKKMQYFKAINSYMESIKLNPLNADAVFNLALTLEVLNEKKLAFKYYKKCLELKPDDYHAAKAIIRLTNV